MAGEAVFAAVDLGGTKILSLLLDERGAVLGHDQRPTEAAQGRDAVLRRVQDSLESAREHAGRAGAGIAAAGVAFAGTYDAEHDRCGQAPNLPGWDGRPVAEPLAALLRCPVRVENDAVAAAWGEFKQGAGQGALNLVYITVSTGIGGGLVLDGKLYKGSGAAGSIGHVPIVAGGPLCGCGARGCLESLSSGVAIAAAGRRAVAAGTAPLLAGLAVREPVTAALVAGAARAGDAAAAAIMRRAGRHLGSGLAALVNLFAPERIVVGGGVARSGPLLLDPAIAVMHRRTLQNPREHVTVVPAALGERAGALGALALLK